MKNHLEKVENYLSDGLLFAKILEDSAKFALRRAFGRINSSKINIILVDLDGTLINSNSPLDALALKFGATKANKIFNDILTDFKAGKSDFDQTVYFTNLAVSNAKLKKSDWENLLDFYLHNGKISVHLLAALKIAKSKKVKVIIATRSSLVFAKTVSDRLGFDGAIGTYISEKNHPYIIGSKNATSPKFKIYTKLGKLSSMFKQHKNFDFSKIAVISNDAMDSQELASSGLGILLTHKNKPSPVEKLARTFELYDLLLKEGVGLEKKLLKAI